MEPIIYQGQELQAQLVNFISGNYTTSTVDNDGDEDLFRDEEGRYYLQRKLNWFDSDGRNEREGSGRTSDRVTIHRINVNAAILWAITRLNSVTLDLRNDAASLLMEGRGYHDPTPTPTMRRVPVLLAANGHDTPSHANRYGVSPQTLEAATRYAATARRTLEEMIAEFLEMTADMAPQRQTDHDAFQSDRSGADREEVAA